VLTDKLKDRFDFPPNGLTRVLQRHHEPVPADFTDKVLRKPRQAQEQKILARVVLQERIALAGCVVFCGISFVAATVFPDIVAAALRGMAASVLQICGALTGEIQQTIRAFIAEWQTYTIPVGALGFAVYSFIELSRGNGLKTT